MLGEHGDSSFIPWSIANLSNIPVLEYKSSVSHPTKVYPALDTKEVENYVKKSGARVIARKGATFYAVSVSVCHICKCLLSGVDTALTVSTMMHGEYGLDDVALSLLCNVGKDGIHSKLMLPLSDEETAALRKSADALKEIIRQTEF